MARPKTIQEQWPHQYIMMQAVDFSKDQLYGRSPAEVKAFAKVLVAASFMHTEVLVATWEGELYLLSGTKRIMACQFMISMEKDDWTSFVREALPGGMVEIADRPQSVWQNIPIKKFLDMPPEIQALVSASDNEHRSDNDFNTFRQIKEMERLKKWDEISVLWRINKGRVKALEKLGGLSDWETVFDAFDDGQIAESTIKNMALLNVVLQDALVKTLKERQEIGEKKGYLLTNKDIKKAKGLRAADALSGLSTRSFDLPVQEEDFKTPDGRYVFEGTSRKFWYVNLANARRKTKKKEGQLYRLIEI